MGRLGRLMRQPFLQFLVLGAALFLVYEWFGVGRGFSESVFQLEPGQWQGLVLSGYGVHLVFVHTLQQSEAPTLETIREKVAQDWLSKQQQELQERYVERVMDSYELLFEEDSLAETLGARDPAPEV